MITTYALHDYIVFITRLPRMYYMITLYALRYMITSYALHHYNVCITCLLHMHYIFTSYALHIYLVRII